MENNKLKNWDREKTKYKTEYSFIKSVEKYQVTAHVNKSVYPASTKGLWMAEILLRDEDSSIIDKLHVGFYKTKGKADKRLIRQIEKFKNPEDFRGHFYPILY